jgi:hypothetical protein
MTRTPRIKQRNNHISATVGDIPVSFRHERLIIAGLCLAAAIRVFIFSAAFPFFNNVDEVGHFDLVFKYSCGHLPFAPLEKHDQQAAKIIGENGSFEYLYSSSIQLENRNAIVLQYIKMIIMRHGPGRYITSWRACGAS